MNLFEGVQRGSKKVENMGTIQGGNTMVKYDVENNIQGGGESDG